MEPSNSGEVYGKPLSSPRVTLTYACRESVELDISIVNSRLEKDLVPCVIRHVLFVHSSFVVTRHWCCRS